MHTVTGSHNFEVQNYALTKGRGIGEHIASRTFFVGEYEWAINIYPHGDSKEFSDYISVVLELKSRVGKPRIRCSFSLLDYASGEAVYKREYPPHTFKRSKNWCFPNFLERNIFEASKCLKQDSLTIICNVTVIKEPVTYIPFTVRAPPNINKRLGGLLLTEKGVDITVEVGGKSFHANKCILAASSSVFEALLFGQMKESKKKRLKITDMEASVFEAVLHFIYNDTLPEIDKDADTVMTQHLLVAADRYLLERLRFTCEQKLCTNLDTSTVGTTLALAEQHKLPHLKAECLRQLASSQFLRSAIETDGFEHLLKSCPNVVKDIYDSCQFVASNNTREIDSVSQVHTITGTHNFEVQNYALTKGHGVPRGSYSFSLLDYASGEAMYTKEFSRTFKSSSNTWGFREFLEIKTLEASKCLEQDNLTIICNVKVIKEPVTYNNVPFTDTGPPSNIHQGLSGLLLSKKGVDITVEVGGKSFPAHKCVLDACSPVFEAQLFGQMKESKTELNITNMEVYVFEAVLHFIYNDALPEIAKDADTVMTQHLLVAADRYLLERLRFTCEQKLCNNLDTNNVGTTLALAELHNLPLLKAECLRQLASPQLLRSSIETDGFEHLLKSCPRVVKDIISKMI
ncbi:BTB/POZ and MATH domain-containing protein 2-like [Carex rostrata]